MVTQIFGQAIRLQGSIHQGCQLKLQTLLLDNLGCNRIFYMICSVPYKMIMDLCSFVARYLGVRKKEPKGADQGLILTMLPVEILLQIKDFLPLRSAVSLTICCRELFLQFGDQSLRCSRSADQLLERKLFLFLLESDLADWRLCHHCIVYHPVAKDCRPGSLKYYLEEPDCVVMSGNVHMDVSYILQYHDAQLLMNNYRFGRPYRKVLEGLSRTSTATVGDTAIETKVWGCIVSGELLLRVSARLRLPDLSDLEKIEHRVPEICPHMYRRCAIQSILLENNCRSCLTARVPCIECRKRRSCRKCSTWYQLNGRDFGDQGIEIHIDMWRYLGSCVSPFDARWRSQIANRSLLDTMIKRKELNGRRWLS